MDNGQWTMDNGQWTMDNGQWIMDHSDISCSVALRKRHCFADAEQTFDT